MPLGSTTGTQPTVPATVDTVPPADVWREAAQSGDPVAVGWDGRVFAVQVALNPHVDPATFPVLDVDGTPLPTDHLSALQGHVVGEADSTVRVTLNGDSIDGMILGVAGAPHLGFSTEDGETRVTDPAENMKDLPFEPRRIDDDPMPGEQTGGNGCGIGLTAMGSPFGLVSGWPERTIDIAFAVDDNYANGINGGDWLGATIALANRLDGFYDHENDLRFSPVHVIRVSQSLFGSPTTNHYLDVIEAYYSANHASLYRELVYLMSGTDFTNALGQAQCIGGAGNGRSHYATGWMLFEQEVSFFFGPFQIYGDGSLKTIAHEVGHQLGLLHDQHNCVEVAESLSPTRPLDVCTTMAPFVDLHGVGFSTWSRLSSRGLADQRDL